MRLKKNKLKKFNSFDVMDAELLENYLNEMLLEGWMITEISRNFIKFEKVNFAKINFFVDITTKGSNGNNENNLDYINDYKEKNVEHICGNEIFQIFINNSGDEKLNRQELNHKIVFKEYYSMIFTYALILLNIYLIGFKGENFIMFITNIYMIAFVSVFTVILIINVYIFILKLNKYKEIVKKKNKDFDIESNFNKKYFLNKSLNCITIVFLTVSFLLIAKGGISSQMASKNDIPLALEDFNGDVVGRREVFKSSSSSPWGSYFNCSDYAFVYSVKQSYDEVSESYYEEHYEEPKGFISYSLVESKYSKVLDMFLDSTLLKYDSMGYSYKNENNEAKEWGANLVYSVDDSNEKVVVYDDKVLTFVIENNKIDDECIKIIKEKLIN